MFFYTQQYLNRIFFVFINFSKNSRAYIRTEKQANNNENIERKYLENMRNNHFFVLKI